MVSGLLSLRIGAGGGNSAWRFAKERNDGNGRDASPRYPIGVLALDGFQERASSTGV